MAKAMEILEKKGWKTPNTYNSQIFGWLPKSSGVYALVRATRIKGRVEFKILYIGMSLNLARRFKNHEVKGELDRKRDFVQIWFKRCPADKLRVRERNLIRKFNPPYNIMHRVRGEV